MTKKKLPQRALLASALMAALAPAAAQQTEENVAQVVVLGSRTQAKTALDTAVPVGLIGSKDLQSAGSLELGKILQDLDPSFNFTSTFISDGTDIIRPATLRGLGPDQLLVLVNGKRRHQQALVNVQQTIGRGSAGTDINAIPLSAIQSIEVLRDGAAAQYGSDAISGVINIILKKGNQGAISASAGTTDEGDGDTISLSAHKGFALGADGGYLNLSAEARDREETNRAGVDTLRVDPPRVTQRIGDSDAKDYYLWMNASLPVAGGEFYTFGGASKRKGDSSGFYRSAGDDRNVPAVYPNGFLPNIITTVKDASISAGYRHDLSGDWSADISLTHGRSQLQFHERNSINVSYYYETGSSPLEADTGTLKFDQTTFNLDFTGSVEGIDDRLLYLATGVEWSIEPTFTYLGSLLYLSVFGSVIAFVVYFTIARTQGYALASYISALTPPIAMLVSVLFENARFGWVALAGLALVLAGQVLLIRAPKVSAA